MAVVCNLFLVRPVYLILYWIRAVLATVSTLSITKGKRSSLTNFDMAIIHSKQSSPSIRPHRVRCAWLCASDH